jgi:hypothetical protein
MIRTTLSFIALFGLLALACHLTFSNSESRPASGSGQPAATSTRSEKPGSGTSSPADERIREVRRESSPLSILREPAQLKTIGQSAKSDVIALVDFEEELPSEAPSETESEEATNTTEPADEKTPEEASTNDAAENNETQTTSEENGTESESEQSKKKTNGDTSRSADEAGATSSSSSSQQKDEEKTKLPPRKEPELTPELILLREEIRECLSHYFMRPENAAARSPWACMHAMIAFGVDANLIVGTQRVNAIGFLNYNGNCNGQQLFYTRGGKLHARIGPGVQGHAGQYLAMLAQSRVKKTFPIKCDGEDFTVEDLIEYEKLTCRPNTELTFKLIALSHYLRSDESWTSSDGQTWDIPRLIREELNQKIVGAACGGTHRLTGFSYAVRKREQRGEVMEGQWLRAKKYIEAYHQYTFRLQNPDGSFSTEWFVGRADNGPPSRRLETTGHITEWLAFSLSNEELRRPEMVKAVKYLTRLLYDLRNEKSSIGPLGHGLHALAIYDERVFGGQPGKRAEQLARYARPTVIER